MFTTFAPTVGVHEFDVTSQVIAAIASGRKLSIWIHSSQLISGTSNTSYGSRENVAESNRPVFIVTTQ